MLSRGDETIAYTAFDKPYALTNANGEVTKFYYDGNENRYKKKTSSYETLYLDKIYERKLYSGEGTDEFTGYFYFGDKLVAMQVLQGEPRVKSYRYTHADSLGSISFITDEDANIVEQRSYEPFGEIRSMNYGNGIVPANMTNITTRSFTNHEQIGEMEGLIHMDGRVYDSTIGRFVSADIHVTDSYNTQSYNRYSYVKNNPLGFTDPSGYDWRIVNKEGFKEHLIQQKMDTAPTSIQTSKDHTPKNGSVRSWATQQVRLENPNLFADGGNYKLYLIDTESGFFGDSLGKLRGGNGYEDPRIFAATGIHMTDVSMRNYSKEDTDRYFWNTVGAFGLVKGAIALKEGGAFLWANRALLLEKIGVGGEKEFFGATRNGYKIFNKNGTLTNEAIKNSRIIIKAKDLGNPRIPSGYGKYTTKHYDTPSGKADTHFYMNEEGKIHYDLDYKSNF